MQNTIIKTLNKLANSIEKNAVKIIDDDKIVAWGKLRRSIKTKVDAQNLTIDVFADQSIAPYAQYVHEGRKAGRMPPVGPIEEWARKKQLLSQNNQSLKLPVRLNTKTKLSDKQQKLADQYHSLACAIAIKMKKKEIKPKRFLIEAIVKSLQEFI
ncbi:MAG: hypothetical protein GX294_05640 [Candidatus Cloacimonetes bacterium]|nr:hypothetical protein [Candidatus Cloacimonadota bacterium]